jgi:hypothetical protein
MPSGGSHCLDKLLTVPIVDNTQNWDIYPIQHLAQMLRLMTLYTFIPGEYEKDNDSHIDAF